METKSVALLLALLGAATIFLAQQTPSKRSVFESWKANHTISFVSETENIYREKVFHENLARIETHNSQNDKSYEMGLNQFSAMTQEEFAQTYLTLIVPVHHKKIDSTDDLRIGDVDWVSQGAVTTIKNQGQCGSCWAFSATGALQGLSKLAYGSLQSFSEQQLVDCSSSYGNHGCDGGLMDSGFKYVRDHGIVHQEEYPYTGKQGACKREGGPFKISGFTDIRGCNDLALAVASRPVSVAVDATNWSTYKEGVFNNCKTSLNHGVTLVGVSDNSWTVKNSWGSTWGQKGFIRLSRGNTCGVCNAASFPLK